MQKQTYIKALISVFLRECKRIISEPLYLFGILGVPLFCTFFFTSLMQEGLPKDIPIAVVDNDNTALSRTIMRNLDAMEQAKIEAKYANISDARQAMQRGEIYGFYHIPENFSKDIQAFRQPKISFYTNNSYLVPGSLLFKEMKKITELAAAASGRKILYAKGVSEEKALALLQPIVVEAHALKNPWLNYSIYLNNIIIPGILCLMIFLMTVYSIGIELKEDTSREWLQIGNNSIFLSLIGKLLPQTILFSIMGIFYNLYLYGYLSFPLNNGISPMLLATFCLILASQACGIFMIAVAPTLRMGLSIASLWGMISFSISGFSFPAIGMYPSIQAIGNLFPLRHYYLIYVSQALNGYPFVYIWKQYLFLLLFILLPLIFQNKLKKALIYYKYIP